MAAEGGEVVEAAGGEGSSREGSTAARGRSAERRRMVTREEEGQRNVAASGGKQGRRGAATVTERPWVEDDVKAQGGAPAIGEAQQRRRGKSGRRWPGERGGDVAEEVEAGDIDGKAGLGGNAGEKGHRLEMGGRAVKEPVGKWRRLWTTPEQREDSGKRRGTLAELVR